MTLKYGSINDAKWFVTFSDAVTILYAETYYWNKHFIVMLDWSWTDPSSIFLPHSNFYKLHVHSQCISYNSSHIQWDTFEDAGMKVRDRIIFSYCAHWHLQICTCTSVNIGHWCKMHVVKWIIMSLW